MCAAARQAGGVRAAARPLGILCDRAELPPDQPLDRVERAAGVCGGLAANRVSLSARRRPARGVATPGPAPRARNTALNEQQRH